MKIDYVSGENHLPSLNCWQSPASIRPWFSPEKVQAHTASTVLWWDIAISINSIDFTAGEIPVVLILTRPSLTLAEVHFLYWK